MPSLFMKRLSRCSLPVKSSATTYRFGRTFLAASIIYCKGKMLIFYKQKVFTRKKLITYTGSIKALELKIPWLFHDF